MASNNKKVTLDVAIQTQEEKLDKLDKELENIKQKTNDLSNKKLQLKVEADTNKLKDVDAQIKKVESELKQLQGKANVDDSEVKALQSKLQSLKNERINIQADIDQSKLQIDKNNIQMQIAVEKSQLEHAKAEADSMDGQEINMSLDLAMENFSQGIASCKQGVQDLYDNIKQVEQAGIQSEQNLAFLSLNLGADRARDTFKEISDIVATMPGDDNTMRSVLSTAQALGNNLNSQEMRDAAATMADYMSGSATMGKMAVESQQDIMKYLLDGNTAELERGSIVSAYVDKLKEAKTFQERQKAMQEVLNQLGYGGISQMDTMLNKQAEWEGMMYNSKDALSSMWLGAEKGAMDYILKLNDATNGLVGMGIVAGQMVLGPLTDIMTGLGQIGTGFRTLKDAADWAGISEKLGKLKTGLIDVGNKAKDAAVKLGSTLANGLKAVATAAKEAVVWLGKAALEVLKGGVNAAKAAVGWLAEKAAKLADIIVTKAAAAAQWLLNAAMMANPVYLVVAAIIALVAILAYLYFNNEQVRQAIDGLGQALWGLGETIYGSLVGAFEWLQGAWQNTIDWFTNGSNAISEAVDGAFTWLSDSIYGIIGAAFEWLQGAWQNTIDFLSNGTTTISETITGGLQWLTDSWNNVVNTFMTYAPMIAQVLFVMATGGIGAIVLLLMNMNGMPNQVGAILQSVISRVVSFVGSFVSNLGNGARQAVSNFASGISNLGNALRDELNGMLSDAANFVGQIGQIMWNAAVNAWNNFLAGLQRHSPGKMMREFKAEIMGIVGIGEDAETPLGSAMHNLARTATNMFNPNLNYDGINKTVSNSNITNNHTSNLETLLTKILEALSGQTGNIYQITINEDMDTDERVERIITEISRRIDWSNDTAGRTV